MKRNNTIRLTESKLRNIIRESIRQAIYEGEAWANQPPINEFHPDWWYYRQEIGPEGMEDDLYDAGNGTAETVGPFVPDRASFLNKRTKAEQMASDWKDLRDFYPYGGEVPYDKWQAEEDELNGDNWNQSQYPPSYEIDRDWD